MDRYLAGEVVTEAALLEDLHRAMARGSFFPVVPACSTSGVGCGELLDLIVRGFPAPSEHPPPEAYTPEGKPTDPVTCDPDGPLLAEVVKTASDPYVGRVSLVRVFSGSLDADRPVHVSGHLTSFFGEDVGHQDHDDDERVGSLSYPFGQHLSPAKRVVAGDIASVGRLTRGRDRRHPVVGGRPAGAAPLDPADAPAPGRHRGGHQVRRGQALDGARSAGGRGPVAPRRHQQRAGRAVDDGRGARGRCAGAARGAVRRVGQPGRRPWCRCARRSRGRARPWAGT